MGSGRPAVAAWWERIEARPSYRAAMLECQHPLVAEGTRAIAAEKARNGALRALYAGGS